MSNHLAIATVTAALKVKIEEALGRDVPDAHVRIGRPQEDLGENNKAVVNLFLYQVTPNPTLRNIRMPVRDGSGGLVEKPMVALNLHYLFSFYGEAEAYQPERILGSTARVMEQEPLLQRSVLEKAIEDSEGTLADSDLHEAAELVRAHPASLSLEELSKLWSVFFQVPYALSVVYECRYVLVEAEEAVAPGLPVTGPSVALVPIGGPRIDAIESSEGSHLPIVWGGTALIRGEGFDAFGLGLRVGAVDVRMSEVKVGANVIELPLKTGAFAGEELAAGIHLVCTVLPAPEGAPAHLKRTSDSVPLFLRSTLSLPEEAVDAEEVDVDPPPPWQVMSGEIKVSFSPKIVKGQDVRLFLDERVTESPQSYILAHKKINENSYPAATLTFPFVNVKASTYLMRAQVDGVDSALETVMDPSDASYRQIIGPEVTIQ